MASVSGYSELTRFDNTTRLMGISNTMFNTNDLVEAELSILDLQAEPKRQQQTLLQGELDVWKQFQTDFKALTKSFSDLRFFKTGQKAITYTKEGVASFTTTSSAAEGEYTLKVNRLAEKQQIAGADMGGADTALGLVDTLKVNDKDFQITDTMTLRDVVNSLNGGDYGVSASIISNRLVLTSKEAGSANIINLTDGANGSLQTLGVLNSDGTVKNQLRAAQDSEFVLNGISMSRTSNVITDVLEGVTINLTNTSTEEVRIGVANDSKAAIAAVESMVNAYNKSILQYKSYTDKGTYLQGQSIPLNVRRAMTELSSFSSNGNFLFQYGVEVDGTAKDGTLKLDKTKLEEMYKESPDKFNAMFLGESGLGKFMESKLQPITGETGSIKGKIDGINKSLESINDSLEQFDTYYENQKNTILKKYASFESMLAGLNSQLEYMQAQMSSLTGSNNNK